MSKPTSITQFEIEAKITGAVHTQLMRGSKVSDFGAKEIARLSGEVMPTFSPEARKTLIKAGVQLLIRRILGEKIAAEIWSTGKGWSIAEDEVRAVAKRLRFEDEDDALKCLAAFREALPDMTPSDVEEFPTLHRFKPLFALHSGDVTLGTVATLGALAGDKLARSFLAWKEIEA